MIKGKTNYVDNRINLAIGVIKEGEYKTGREVACPEYETIVSFGSLILNDNLGSLVRANELCNAYGIDTISAGSTIAFVYYLFNNGPLQIDLTHSSTIWRSN